MAFLVDPAVLERVKRIEIPWNEYGIDPYGAVQVDIARMLTTFGFFYKKYFSMSVEGIGAIPAKGRGMLIGNHSGGFAVDAMMVIASAFYELDPPRLAQGMVEKFLSRLPLAAMNTARSGQLVGVPENAVRLLNDDRLLMVFPEGARGTAKLYRDRHTLVRFGTGFMRLAMETKTPIIPFGFAGGGDAVPTIANLYRLGRLVGVPYIPVTPYLFPVPLRVPLRIQFGEPMVFEGTGTEEDAVIAANVQQVMERIAGLIDEGERARRRMGDAR
jgi:1-acyl-sn-glycerol-3-phosphate acyltransferase